MTEHLPCAIIEFDAARVAPEKPGALRPARRADLPLVGRRYPCKLNLDFDLTRDRYVSADYMSGAGMKA